MTREEWLLKGTDVLRERLFGPIQNVLPQVKVSVGFPTGSRSTGKNLVQGQIWAATSTADGVAQIFISPQIDDAVQALAVLTHELCHACTPGDGHGSKFGALSKAVGLIGPLRATTPSADLLERLRKLAAWLGPYPHAAIRLGDQKKQATRLIKVFCRAQSGYSARVTRKWLDLYGAPYCPCKPCIAAEMTRLQEEVKP